ncbi:hypothetical protein B0A48_10301 [Cryoendolithus antarcticus]|uniref:Enhancer of polycomb-like protein n=1 Tax=Cryoendolithus antarcticus TaxID=1507870 RepID=A0A1V8SWV1_9PEZI|nr:hypothetical protein B0A48_10301 [Cryoendolithus antarcticus]
MSTRASNARHVRQRKLNTKQQLRIIREDEIDDQGEGEGHGQVTQVETGVEKAEETEFHLQKIIQGASAAALGDKINQSYIPTPDATRAQGVEYDKLYPKTFSQPATYIRFSSTVEDCIGVPYCMDEEDEEVLAKLNEGKDVHGNSRRDKLGSCTEDTFEETMHFFEEASQRRQPFANLENASHPSLDEMEQEIDENLSDDAQKWLRLIYQHWIMRKGSRPLMPSVKVRVLDTNSEADDADPYICFRRREVRQTRKTRGRDAQVVEKLKKLRLELEQARSLVQMVVQRETLHKQQLEMSRKVFEQRAMLKKVKIEKGIIGDKGDDEDLLVNQRPIAKPKPRQSTTDQRPTTIKLRQSFDRQQTENDLPSYEDQRREADEMVNATVEQKKSQHRRWNEHYEDRTWRPITPPADPVDDRPRWGFLPSPKAASYPTPPPTLPSEDSHKEDGDVDMLDAPAPLSPAGDRHQALEATGGASPEPDFRIWTMPGSWPRDPSPFSPPIIRQPAPACRLRKGRGGIMHLEARKQRPFGLCRTVVSDSDDSEDEDGRVDFFAVSDDKIFDYRTALHRSTVRAGAESGERRSLPAPEATMVGGRA